MDTSISKQLVDKLYEKRKAAALELEKQIRECHQQGDHRRISQIVDQLVDMFSNPGNALQARNGGLIGLAGTAIALGVDIAPYMERFIQPLLICFTDPENRVRYFSAECLYNIAKVSKGEILVYFNDIFDALSKLAADSELSVKNGAELLDRLLKDIVAETASVYVPQFPETLKARLKADENQSVLIIHPDDLASGKDLSKARRAFSLEHFIPLLRERIYVLSPFTRSYLVTWISVLDSVPELQLISFLPEFLDGLLKYLSDPTEDVRIATENLLSEFLSEIREYTMTQRAEEDKLLRYAESDPTFQPDDSEKDNAIDVPPMGPGRTESLPEYDDLSLEDHQNHTPEPKDNEPETNIPGSWRFGLGVKIDYAAIAEILIQQLDNQPEHDEIQQSTALRWLSEFLTIAKEVMVPFTPRLLVAILPNLAHHAPMIQSAANRTNKLLLLTIQSLPPPSESSTRQNTDKTSIAGVSPLTPGSPTPTAPSALAASRPGTASRDTASSKDQPMESPPDVTPVPGTPMNSGPRPRLSTAQFDASRLNSSMNMQAQAQAQAQVQAPPQTQTQADGANATQNSRPDSPISAVSGAPQSQFQQSPEASVLHEKEKETIDYQATVNALMVQFLSEHEETRVAALKWLIMLHQKAPKKILAMDDGTFPALLKTLSDSSEEVIKHDLQLLAQISSSSEESYFKSFMNNLLELFSTDRKLLEMRGSLIIRQLCLNLNAERIYRTFAEILEKEEDLEFASGMVLNLNMILITSPELSEFRRRLKSLETRQDGQALFTTLYRSWCHNPVAVFSLCLLAQAYEHASNLLNIFADLEITVPLLVQIDKLVQLLESPVFTYLRLQLLEPEKYPFLFKCLYGLLMLLPQSTAFVSLHRRLSAVHSAGFLHIAPKPSISNVSATRSKLGRDDIKWNELLSHFRGVQNRHEKARRQASGEADLHPMQDFAAANGGDYSNTRAGNNSTTNGTERGHSTTGTARPGVRRRVTGEAGGGSLVRPPSRALSPLNPRARGGSTLVPSGLAQNSLASAFGAGTGGAMVSPTFQGQQLPQQQPAPTKGPRRTLSISRK